LRKIDFAWPIWGYLLGSGGKAVTTFSFSLISKTEKISFFSFTVSCRSNFSSSFFCSSPDKELTS